MRGIVETTAVHPLPSLMTPPPLRVENARATATAAARSIDGVLVTAEPQHRHRAAGPTSVGRVKRATSSLTMDRCHRRSRGRGSSQDDEDIGRLYDCLLDGDVLNDVHTLAESLASASAVSSLSALSATGDDEDAWMIADRLLERNADDVERALDAAVRKARLSVESQLADARWPQLVDVRPTAAAAAVSYETPLRNLEALARVPFTCDTYVGAHFRKLTRGLEQAIQVDALFGPAARVYAKLVDVAPDFEGAAESFGSLCEATHARCGRRRGDPAAAAVSLMVRCLAVVCRRGAAVGSKALGPAVVEFVAAVTDDDDDDDGGGSAYTALCCIDPAAGWFDSVAKYGPSRTAFFACLRADRRGLLKAVVSSLVGWTFGTQPPPLPSRNRTARDDGTTVRYACALHAANLLSKMLRYRAARDLFPVKTSRTAAAAAGRRVHATGLADRCLAYLSTNRDRVPTPLACALCRFVAVVIAFHPDGPAFDSVTAAADPSGFGVRVVAAAVERQPTLAAQLVHRTDELFAERRWKDDLEHAAATAAALSTSHEAVWRLITAGKTAFLEAVTAAASRGESSAALRRHCRTLMTNVRSTPLGAAATHRLDDPDGPDDWSDPRRTHVFVVCCATGPGRSRLTRAGAFRSLDAFVAGRLDDHVDLPFEPAGSLDAIVDAAYSYCASFEGLKTLLDDGAATEGASLAGLYYLSHEQFDDHPIARDVLVMLWLRLIEAATHSFSSRVHADLKLNYQDTLLKLTAENRTEDGAVIVDEKTELLTKLQRPLSSTPGQVIATDATVDGEARASVFADFLSNADCRGSGGGGGGSGVWLQRIRSTVVRTDQISNGGRRSLSNPSGPLNRPSMRNTTHRHQQSDPFDDLAVQFRWSPTTVIIGSDTVDLIISFGRRRFADLRQSDPTKSSGAVTSGDRQSRDLTDFEAAGIRLALRYGSTVGLAAEDSASELLGRVYVGVERPRRTSGLFDCVTCTLFIASRGSENKCFEACAVFRKLAETARFVWPPVFVDDDDDNDDDDDDENTDYRTAAFGHLVEGLLQREQPEVHNAFKMAGVSWWLLCSGWSSDCFWGRLSWPEICRWLCLVVLFSVDYQAFFFTCLAAARRRHWLEAFSQGRFRDTVYQGDFGDFRLADHVDYLESLAKKYQRTISKRLVSDFDAF